ncbi:MAG: alpha/beta hydrolase [Myxococcales bacterium FL481]|nr:MAG: alpha/beta hydrolase [Myxococcales bacterium FL481]
MRAAQDAAQFAGCGPKPGPRGCGNGGLAWSRMERSMNDPGEPDVVAVSTEPRRRPDRAHLHLSNGRRMAYVDFGPSSAPPVLLLHGGHGSAYYFAELPGSWFQAPRRWIGVDRPGYGNSDYWRYSYTELAEALEQLCRHLGLRQVTVVGVSAGGACSLACGAVFPALIDRIVAVSPIAPLHRWLLNHVNRTNRTFYWLARNAPWLSRANAALVARASRDHLDRFMALNRDKLCLADRREVDKTEVREALMRSAKEAYSSGSGGGLAQDMENQVRPWDFRLEDVQSETHVWGFDQDTSAPPQMAQYIHDRLPNGHLHVVPDAGHLWHICNFETILTRSSVL